jgi:ABC-2 type transport system permease protein
MPRAASGADWFAARELTMSSFFSAFPWVAAVVLPAVSMRAWSEDFRGGSFQLLATIPIRTPRVVMGKFLAFAAFLGLMLFGTAMWPVMVLGAQYSSGSVMEIGTVFGGYVGCLALGASFIAVGMFIGSLSNSQMAAYIATLVVCGGLVAWRQFTGVAEDEGGTLLAMVINYVSVEGHFTPIARGHLKVEGLVWYGSIATMALALNVLALDRRRHA